MIVSNDIRNMDESTKTLYTNQEVTAVDQDTLGGTTKLGVIQGRKVKRQWQRGSLPKREIF
ncbi:MAG: hypothetical protein PHC61_16725 [Chitinivibrionales bacterium]|nr:hypothetical protein [Chitinivibrionales bacterium]